MDSIGLGIIGLGHVSTAHLVALSQQADFNLTAFCDTEPSRLPESHSAKKYSNVDEMLTDPDVEAVLIAVPLLQHFGVARRCLSAGKHVLLEKPATESGEQLHSLSALAEDQRVRLHIAFHAAFASDLLWFLQNRDSVAGRLGALRFFACEFFDPYLGGSDQGYAIESLLGSWADSGINALSVACSLVPDLRLSRTYRTRVAGCDADDLQATAHFAFGGAASEGPAGHGRIDTNWTLGLNQKHTWLYFEDPSVSLLLDHSNQRVLECASSGAVNPVFDGAHRGERLVVHYTGVFADFAQHLRRADSNAVFALKCHELFFSVWHSAHHTSTGSANGT